MTWLPFWYTERFICGFVRFYWMVSFHGRTLSRGSGCRWMLAAAAEQEKRRLVRIQMEPRDHQGGKPVDGLPHVRVATGQIDVLRREFSD